MIDYFKKLQNNFTEKKDFRAISETSSDKVLTYGALDYESGRMYGYLKSIGIQKEDRILLCLERGVKIVPAILGIWKAGAAVVVCENTMAPERIRYIAANSDCKLTIDDELMEEIFAGESVPGFDEPDIHDAAYIVYTSGTTGNPKGIIHEFGNLDQSLTAKRYDEEQLVQPTDIVALNSPFNFVASMDFLINATAAGAELIIIDTLTVKNPVTLMKCYKEKRVTATFMTPSLFRTCESIIPDLRWIALGGEPCSNVYSDKICLFNGYSSSEAGRDITLFKIDKKYDVTPIGKNRGNEIIHLITEAGKEAEVGEAGEISYENPFIRGYLGLPEKTEAAWYDGMYHSGDIGVRLPDGNIVLSGRNDDMIKINGNRIEPAEIESVAKRVLDLSWVAAKGFITPKKSFVALYYTDERTFNTAETRDLLAQSLPSYMLPSYFIHLDSIPMLPNGKVDKKSIPIPDVNDFRAEYVAPKTDLEKKLAVIFGKILELEDIGINDDFFEIGGDSLRAISAVSEANITGLDVPKLYKYRTIHKISRAMEKQGAGMSDARMEALARSNTQPLTPFQTFMLDYQLYSPRATMYNMYTFLKMPASEIDSEKLKDAVCKVLENHPAFKTVLFYDDNLNLVQKYVPEIETDFSVEHVSEEELDGIKDTLVYPFKLLDSPLYRARIFDTKENVYLFIDIHHIIGDGTTLKVLIKNISKAYYGRELKKDYFYSYAAELALSKHSEDYEEAKKYFENRYGNKEWVSYPKPDFDSRDNTIGLNIIDMDFDRTEYNAFLNKYGLTINAFFTCVSLLMLSSFSGSDEVLTSWMYSGRDDKKKEQSIGMFISSLPVAVSFNKMDTLNDFFQTVKEQISKGIQYSIYPYILNHNQIALNDTFCVQNQTDLRTRKGLRDINFTPIEFMRPDESSCYLMLFQIIDTDKIRLWLSYISEKYKPETINKISELLKYYANQLLACPENDKKAFKSLLKK